MDSELSLLFRGLVLTAMTSSATACGCGDPYTEDKEFTLSGEQLESHVFEGELTSTCEAICAARRSPEGGNLIGCAFGDMELPPIGWPTDEHFLELTCTYEVSEFCTGRRPAGLASGAHARGDRPEARWLAEAAHLEAASVTAFLQLADELRHHGAPTELVDQCIAAARDETLHATRMSAHARAHGAEPEQPCIESPCGPRSLREIALDNATEGCVFETFGALLATYQAEAATDPAFRETIRIIAEDETRHAELAWAIDAWICARIPTETREEVIDARRSAVHHLTTASGTAHAPSLGLPPPAHRARLLLGVLGSVWA